MVQTESTSVVKLFRRAPRMTSQEAIVLNTLINSNERPVTIERLITVLYGAEYKNSKWYRPLVMRLVSTLRAKLGEEKHIHNQIVTVKVERNGTMYTAYRLVD